MRFIRFTGSRHAGRTPGSVVRSQEDPRINCGILVANLGGSPKYPEVTRLPLTLREQCTTSTARWRCSKKHAILASFGGWLLLDPWLKLSHGDIF